MLGNSLLGTTPELIAAGIPTDAFKPILGDDKKIVAELRKRNARELSGQLALDMAAATADADTRALAERTAAIAGIDDHSIAGVREQQRRFEQLLGSPELRRAGLAADVWCAAFVADKRPSATSITQDTLVRAISGEASLSAEELAVVRQAREAYSFLHWHVTFPAVWERGGFDVVLGNPPWERVKLQEKEFFAARSPEIATAPNKAARERLINALAKDDPALLAAFEDAKREAEGASHLIRDGGRYPLCGRGDVNTYAIFAELMRDAVGRVGRAGVIVPSGIATDDTTKHFFQTAHTEGGLLPADLLQRVADGDGTLGGLRPSDYHLAPGERLDEAVSRSWTRLTGAWSAFDEARAAPPARRRRRTADTRAVATHPVRRARLRPARAAARDRDRGQEFPGLHPVAAHADPPRRLRRQDRRAHAGVKGAAGQSPHSLLQELLNRSPERLWGIVSNGLVLRVLRDSVALTRQAYLEFDLEAMFTGEIYADFVLLWLVCHQSRVEAERPEECWLERWTRAAGQDGTRALDALRQGVQEAIETLGGGFLAHPANHELHAALRDGDTRRPRLLPRAPAARLPAAVPVRRRGPRRAARPAGDPLARERYLAHYSTRRLRALAAAGEAAASTTATNSSSS